MMKMFKKVIIVLLIVLVLYFVLVYVECNRFIKKDNDLLISTKTTDNTNHIQYGLLYKAIRYNTTNSQIKNGKALVREFNSIIFNKKYYEYKEKYDTPIDINSFELNDTKDYSEYGELYREGNSYYSTTNPNSRYIVFKDNTKIFVKDALNKKMVTINQLRQKGLNIIELVKDDNLPGNTNRILKTDVSHISSMINNKKSFILVIVQTGCSHCKAYIPKIERLAKAYMFDVYTIDIALLQPTQIEKLKNIVEYSGTPTTYFFKKGKLRENTILGNLSESIIINTLKEEGYIK